MKKTPFAYGRHMAHGSSKVDKWHFLQNWFLFIFVICNQTPTRDNYYGIFITFKSIKNNDPFRTFDNSTGIGSSKLNKCLLSLMSVQCFSDHRTSFLGKMKLGMISIVESRYYGTICTLICSCFLYVHFFSRREKRMHLRTLCGTRPKQYPVIRLIIFALALGQLLLAESSIQCYGIWYKYIFMSG